MTESSSPDRWRLFKSRWYISYAFILTLKKSRSRRSTTMNRWPYASVIQERKVTQIDRDVQFAEMGQQWSWNDDHCKVITSTSDVPMSPGNGVNCVNRRVRDAPCVTPARHDAPCTHPPLMAPTPGFIMIKTRVNGSSKNIQESIPICCWITEMI